MIQCLMWRLYFEFVSCYQLQENLYLYSFHIMVQDIATSMTKKKKEKKLVKIDICHVHIYILREVML